MPKKKQKVKREDLLTAIVFVYQDAQPVYRIWPNSKWAAKYVEGKIVSTDVQAKTARGYKDGYLVEWKVKCYKWRNVPDRPHKIAGFMEFCRTKAKVEGWLHHVNFYTGITARFVGQYKF